jgi:hypothetical protein
VGLRATAHPAFQSGCLYRHLQSRIIGTSSEASRVRGATLKIACAGPGLGPDVLGGTRWLAVPRLRAAVG